MAAKISTLHPSSVHKQKYNLIDFEKKIPGSTLDSSGLLFEIKDGRH